MEEKNTVKFKKEEFSIREYVRSSLGKGKVSRVRIEYTPDAVSFFDSAFLS